MGELVCPACRHATRKHGEDGCMPGCWCDMTPARINGTEDAPEPAPVPEESPLAPPTALDRFDAWRHGVPASEPEPAPPSVAAEADEPPAVPPAAFAAALDWWDSWRCRTCFSRYFTPRPCCGEQAEPVRVFVVPREVSGG